MSTITLAAMALLFGLIAAGAVLFLYPGNRRRILEKTREVHSREKLFDLLTEHTEDIFILFSPEDFTAEYVSPDPERILGLEAGDVRRDVRPLLFGMRNRPFPDSGQPLSGEVPSAVPMGGVWIGERDVIQAKACELRWFKELLCHCRLENRDRFILMRSGRTKERRMYEMLGEALQTAKAANEAKSDFPANMSHDIRTPHERRRGFAVF